MEGGILRSCSEMSLTTKTAHKKWELSRHGDASVYERAGLDAGPVMAWPQNERLSTHSVCVCGRGVFKAVPS